jgi:deoxyribodipyrimidine photo-lyase
MTRTVPADRLRAVNPSPVQRGSYVLYWMIAARRTRWSFGLQRARELSEELGLPLLVLDALRVGYPHASDRLHTFAIHGMADVRARLAAAGVRHLAYVEPRPGAGSGLLEALASEAAAVVTDDWPSGFHPRMVAAAGRRLAVRLEAVDGNGLLPLRASEGPKARAVDFRRLLQQRLRPHLERWPEEDPLAGYDLGLAPLPSAAGRWCFLADEDLADPSRLVATLPIDHAVGPVPTRGGERAAAEAVRAFVEERLPRYAEGRNHPDDPAQSGLSPWLHWGHLSAHEVAHAVLARDGWGPERLSPKVTASREGWWGASPEVEAFLDELITWRELGHHDAHHRGEAVTRYESLPEWARQTLADHAADPRLHHYSLEALEGARTADPVWNAAQRELVHTGRMHNYLRMLWGKKVLEWSADGAEAMARLIHLNDKYALDGRDPNSYAGIGWVLGRFDRPWGPERPIVGKLRYMSSERTVEKLRMSEYLRRWGDAGATGGQLGLFRTAGRVSR